MIRDLPADLSQFSNAELAAERFAIEGEIDRRDLVPYAEWSPHSFQQLRQWSRRIKAELDRRSTVLVRTNARTTP